MKAAGVASINKTDIHRILVRATNWVGDVVMCMPAFDALRQNFPESHIAVLARPWVAALFDHHPGADEIIPYTRGLGLFQDLGERIRVIRLIRNSPFDMAVLFQNAFEAALLSYLGRVPLRVGYNTDGRRLLLSHAVIRDAEILKKHQVEYYLALLRAMGWQAPTKDPHLHVGGKESGVVRELLSTQGIQKSDFLLGLSAGAIFGPAKRWPVERFAAIADRAAQQWGARVVLLGSKKDAATCLTLSKVMKNKSLDLCGKTSLGEAMALIKSCRFFLSNDSGLMHVAAALDVPTVGIFGSTNPVATGPKGKWARIVRHDMDCSPCLKPECRNGYPCLISIEPDEVWQAMEELRAEVERKN
ncbi:MAG: lipopolysaccharide heptosyltransferase II [Deltaproteobacteria bacterium]|nr:lipopolysaccharide heptosyltransferase II [Deltaproteobacteria bacterium]